MSSLVIDNQLTILFLYSRMYPKATVSDFAKYLKGVKNG